MGVSSQLRYLFAVWRLEFAAAMEYRANFLFQTGMMFLNDVFWIFFWFLIMERFDSIAGWGFDEMLLLYAVATVAFGLVMVLFGNLTRLPEQIEEGLLDFKLHIPKNILLQSTARFDYGALGDLLFGLTAAAIVLSWTQVPLFFLLVVLSALVFFGWSLLAASLTFFANRFSSAATVIRETLFTIGLYPFSVYSGRTRLLLLFVIPAGFIGGVPVEILQDPSWLWIGLAAATAAVFFLVGVVTFYAGLRRYESGNLIVMQE